MLDQVRHGFANKLQRYRCRKCQKTFNALVGTPLVRLRHKEKWLNCLKTLQESLTIRKAATVVGVHRTTSTFAFTQNIRFGERHKKSPSFLGLKLKREEFSVVGVDSFCDPKNKKYLDWSDFRLPI